MKKLFSVIMCVLMVMCFMPTLAFATDGVETQEDVSVASVTTMTDGVTTTKYYDTLQAAINAASSGDTVKLLKNVDTSEITETTKTFIIKDKDLTIDTNGYSITDSLAYYTINVKNGALTIKGGGAINKTGNGITTICTLGTLTLENVTVSISNYDSPIAVKVEENGVGNKGTLIVNDGTVINATDGQAIQAWGDVTINGGTMNGKVAAWSVKSWNPGKITVAGGTINGNLETYQRHYINSKTNVNTYPTDSASISVTNGTVNGELVKKYVKDTSDSRKTEAEDKSNFEVDSNITVSGGKFNTDPTAYLAEGKTVVASGDSKYPYEVKSKTDNVEVAKTAEAKVESDVKIDESKTDAEKEAINAEVTKAAEAIKETSITGLEVAAATEATKDAKAQDVESAKNALKVALPDARIDEQTTVNVFVQPYLDIKIADATVTTEGTEKVTGTITELTLDIVPMVKTIATTATEANDIVTESGNGKTKNAVEIEDAKEVKVITPVTITIPLPAGFVTSKDTPLYIKHTKDNRASYVYTATVTSKEVNEKTSYSATFTNPNGFSEFLMTKQNISVAKIGEVGYTTLQDAVNAVKDGETITLTQDAGSATVNRTVSFNVEKGDFTYEIKIGGNSKNSGTDDSYEVVYTAPRHSSSSKSSTVDKTEDPTKDTGAVDEKDSKATATELANALSFKARSSKTAKGNIKVNLTVTDDEIQAIEKLGYTVKYKFYRSTEKSSGYTAMKEKDAKTYTNTTGKSGTRYYYKARVMVYDSDGTLVTYTALKQCKYASRIK